MALGSTVTLSAVSVTGNRTGPVYTTHTTSALGDFEFRVAQLGPLVIEAVGLPYSETSGMLSTASRTLRAFYVPDEAKEQTVHVNLVTQLSHLRIKALLAKGTALPDAIAQAEAELRKALASDLLIGVPTSGVKLSLSAADEDNRAYLFAVGSLLSYTAQRVATRDVTVDVYTQQLLDGAAYDLVDDGKLSDALTANLKATGVGLFPEDFEPKLAAFLSSSGASIAAPDMRRVLDPDHDGVASARDTCPLIANPDQLTKPPGLCATERTAWFPAILSGASTTRPYVLTAAGGKPGLFLHTLGASTHTWVPSDARDQAADLVSITLPSGGPTGTVAVRTVSDLDGDGGNELLINGSTPTLTEGLYMTAGQSGFGSFTKTFGPSPLTVGGITFRGFVEWSYPSSVAVADFDRDGLLDLAGIFGPLTGHFVAVQRQSSPGQWQAPVYVPGQTTAPLTNTLAVDAGDLNHDGKPDLVAGGKSFGIQTFLGDGAGDFVAQSPTAACAGASCPIFLQLADFDLDGHLDLLVVGMIFQNGNDPAFVGVMMGDGSGRFAPLKTLHTVPATFGVPSAYVGDIDGNGRPDIVFTQPSGGVGIFANTPTGFAPLQTLSVPSLLLGTQDINGDGKSDLALQLHVPRGVGWLLSR